MFVVDLYIWASCFRRLWVLGCLFLRLDGDYITCRWSTLSTICQILKTRYVARDFPMGRTFFHISRTRDGRAGVRWVGFKRFDLFEEIRFVLSRSLAMVSLLKWSCDHGDCLGV